MISLFFIIFRFLESVWEAFKDPAFGGSSFFVLFLIVGGTLVYMHLEKWSLIDSFYFCITALTTVGSQLQPATDIGKIFTSFYILLGLGTVGAFISAIASQTKKRPFMKKFKKKK